MRTLVDIPEDAIRRLDALAAAKGWSRAEAVRRAVAEMLARDDAEDAAALMACFGAWQGKGVDGLAHQRAMRAEWERPWDTAEPDQPA
jgi:hypothetical protein